MDKYVLSHYFEKIKQIDNNTERPDPFVSSFISLRMVVFQEILGREGLNVLLGEGLEIAIGIYKRSLILTIPRKDIVEPPSGEDLNAITGSNLDEIAENGILDLFRAVVADVKLGNLQFDVQLRVKRKHVFHKRPVLYCRTPEMTLHPKAVDQSDVMLLLVLPNLMNHGLIGLLLLLVPLIIIVIEQLHLIAEDLAG